MLVSFVSLAISPILNQLPPFHSVCLLQMPVDPQTVNTRNSSAFHCPARCCLAFARQSRGSHAPDCGLCSLWGCRLILIFKAPTPKQAYPADFLAFQQRTFCGICLFFFTSPILGRKIPFLHICSSALAAKLSFDQIFLRISRSHGKETDDIYLYSGQLHTA